jgi:hypothetical protein
MERRTFTLGAVLSALSGKLLCSMDDLYRVLNFLTGEDLYTHQLPRAFKVAAPFVAQQHPELALLDWSTVGRETWQPWLTAQVERFGPTLELEPIPFGAYEAMDPIAEAIEMRGIEP